MDRRRFLPSPEGLEGRALLSLFGSTPVRTSTTATLASLPESIQQKELRVDHLPFFLDQLQPGRFLPASTVQNLQGHLRGVIGQLHAPPSGSVDAFNLQLRHLFSQKNLSPDNAKILNHQFGGLLAGAGATPAQVQALQRDMNELAVVDSKSVDGSRLAANDYALVLQTALAIGRPILRPTAPTLDRADGARVHNNASGITKVSRPTIVGTYLEGAPAHGKAETPTTTVIQVLDAGKVVGFGPLDGVGKYAVKLNVPLANGTHRLSVRAIEAPGFLSAPSPVFVLKVNAPVSAASAQALPTTTSASSTTISATNTTTTTTTSTKTPTTHAASRVGTPSDLLTHSSVTTVSANTTTTPVAIRSSTTTTAPAPLGLKGLQA